MKLLTAIFLLLSIVSTDIVLHLVSSIDHEILLLDNKAENEKDSEKEGENESERDKELTESKIKSLIFNYEIQTSAFNPKHFLLGDSIIEIPLPPPDFV